MLTAPRIVRTDRAVRPCLPMTLPTSPGATRSLRTVFSSRLTVSTSTASGSSTRARAISRTSSSTASISNWVMHVLHPQSFRTFQTIFPPSKIPRQKPALLLGEILSAHRHLRQQITNLERFIPLLAGQERASRETKANLSGDGGSGSRELLDQLGDAVGHLGALADPVLDALMLEGNGGWVGAGIVGADNFDRTAIAGAILLDHDNTVIRLLGGANARQTNHNHGDAFPFSFQNFDCALDCASDAHRKRESSPAQNTTSKYR